VEDREAKEKTVFGRVSVRCGVCLDGSTEA
jgi:hypothetical protein